MADPKIPLSDLPPGLAGAYDKVAGVDTATGDARLFPMPQPGVPKAYETRASLPSASGLTAGTAAWVTNDPNPLLNGTWSVQGGVWVQSADRVSGLEGRVGGLETEIEPLADLSAAIDPITPASDILVIADNDGKAVAKFDSSGALNLPVPPRFSVDEEIRDSINRTRLDPDSHDIYVLTDADGKILFRATADGDLHGPRGLLPQDGEGGGGGAPDAGTVSAYDRGALPYKRGQTAAIVADSVITHAIQHTTTIYGYEDEVTGIPRSKVITNDSLTHPKVLWIPGGWNGYEYWMAVTPYFGQSWGSESENPHILASHDQVSWVEVPPGPIALAPSAPSYWADTHLTLADDGFLYSYFKGYGPMVDGGSQYYMSRSRDGASWSEPEFVGSAGGSVSPVLEPAPRGGFDYFEVGTGMAFPSGKREIVRKWLSAPGVLPDRATADAVTLVNRPWETEYPRSPGEEYDLWHFDAARVGNVYIGIICCRVKAGSGGVYLNYFCWSSDGWVWEVIPGVIGTGLYRSSIVPVSFTQNRAVCDVYLAKTSGVISVHRYTLEFS